MAVVEEGGGSAPKPEPSSRPTLKKWDHDPVLAQANPAPRPQRSPLAGTPFEASRLKTLTPFEQVLAAPADEPTRETSTTPSYLSAPQSDAVSNYGTRLASGPTADDPVVKEEGDSAEPEVTQRGGRAYTLSWDEYNKLSKDQRAAVDFNTMLLQAREKDLNTNYEAKAGGGPNAEYDAAVERMFGERGGSDTYAPETMAVLRSIDYKASGETLDDFLNLDAAVSAKEMKDFEIAPVEASVMYQDGSAKASGALVGEDMAAQKTNRYLEQVLAKGGELIQNLKASAAVNRSPLAVRYGGTANDVTPALGFGEDEDSKYFRMALDALSRDLTPEDLNQVWGALDAKYDDEKLIAFKKFADDMTRDAISFRPPEWTQAEGAYFNPQLIRERLGLDQGGQ